MFSFYQVCWYAGAAFLLKLLVNLIFIIIQYGCKRLNLEKYKGQGKYAMVTGSSDGIGLAMAKILAKDDFNILLVSRNAQKLENAR